MKKKALLLSGLVVVALSAGMVGCGEQPSTTTTTGGDAAAVEVKEVEMSYISTADLKDNIANSEYLVLDVRKAADFEAGHIPGAVNADMDAAKDGDNESGIANMKAALGDPAKVDQKVVLVCYSGKRYAQAGTNVLAALGANMDNVYTLEGGMKAWDEAFPGAQVASNADVKDVEMAQLAPADLEAAFADCTYLVVDVRKAADFAEGHIAGSISADMDAAKEGDAQAGVETMAAAMLAQCGNVSGADQKIVLVCYSGKRYAQCATNSLAVLGANMDNVYALEGGMKAWTEAGYAVEK